jgi:hypothetical protein
MTTRSTTTICCVGIDVAKATLDVALGETAPVWQAANAPDGIAAVVRRVQAVQASLVVLEATALQQEWRDRAGVDIQLELVDPATLASRCASGAFDIALDLPN